MATFPPTRHATKGYRRRHAAAQTRGNRRPNDSFEPRQMRGGDAAIETAEIDPPADRPFQGRSSRA
jgi:hypothetical protein